MRFTVTQARSLVVDSLLAAGVPQTDAVLVANALLDAERSGVDSHGLRLLPGYLDRLYAGGANPAPDVRLVRRDGAVAVLDGDDGLGQVVLDRAIHHASTIVEQHGVATVAVRRSNHLGALGYFVRSVAARGMLGFLCQNVGPNMAAEGGTRPTVGNNPFAIAVPTDTSPLALDMSCSVVAGLRVREAADEGRPLPNGWAIDDRGEPTTDPVAALAGALLPLGGHKGAGMAVMLGALAAVLSDASTGEDVPPPSERARPRGLGHFLLVLDVRRFGEFGGYLRRMRRYEEQVSGGQPHVRLPGRGSDGRRVRSDEDGLVLPAELLHLIRTAGASRS